MQEKWDKLLIPTRFRKSSSNLDEFDRRNSFEKDYSRIISSAPFRRLQDKAQVFPLEKNDFVRTRLTHSLEVSNFARGLGLSVEKKLIEQKKLNKKHVGNLSAILATAGLTHDIGNPPFGHSGEKVIQDFFTEHFSDRFKEYKKFTNEERSDFTNFDGNVQGFRILRKLNYNYDEYSYNLTYPTLASIIKYPKSSTEGNKDKHSKKLGISFKKFGYFQSEKEDFEKINLELGLNNKRHPLTFLLEAADDVAFSVADIEDGCKKRIFTKDILMDILNSQLKNTECKHFIKILETLYKSTPNDFPNKLLHVIEKFRIQAQSFMLNRTVKAFLEKHDTILMGKFDKDLVMESEAGPLRTALKELNYHNHDYKPVLKRELAGEVALNFLLKLFVEAVVSEDHLEPKTREHKIFKLISQKYTYIYNNHNNYPNKLYNKLQLVTDFISSMTDSFSLNLYQELSGHHIE